MTDNSIVNLLRERSEKGIAEVEKKYGRYMQTVSKNIVGDEETAKECVNKSLFILWSKTEQSKVSNLRAYLAKIVRNVSLERYRLDAASKRGGGKTDSPFDELEECLPHPDNVEARVESGELKKIIADFVRNLPERDRTIFTARYFFASSVEEIAKKLSVSRSTVFYSLSKTRDELREKLEKENWI